MKNLKAIRERYRSEPLSTQIGGLAANMARITSFSNHPEHRDVVESLLEESKFLIEWLTPELPVEKQVRVIELQLQLAMWQYTWKDIWADAVQRTNVAKQAQIWAERLIKMSGLIK